MATIPISAMDCMLAISASRPRRMPPFTTRRRSSIEKSSASNSAMAAQSRAAKHIQRRSFAWLAALSGRGAGCVSSSNFAIAASRSASSNTSQRLMSSPSTVRRSIARHSASKPSEVPYAAWVTTAPRLLSRCTASTWVLRSGVRSQMARMFAVMSPGAKAVPRRWSMFTQSGVVAASSCRLNAQRIPWRQPTRCAHAPPPRRRGIGRRAPRRRRRCRRGRTRPWLPSPRRC